MPEPKLNWMDLLRCIRIFAPAVLTTMPAAAATMPACTACMPEVQKMKTRPNSHPSDSDRCEILPCFRFSHFGGIPSRILSQILPCLTFTLVRDTPSGDFLSRTLYQKLPCFTFMQVRDTPSRASLQDLVSNIVLLYAYAGQRHSLRTFPPGFCIKHCLALHLRRSETLPLDFPSRNLFQILPCFTLTQVRNTASGKVLENRLC